MRFLIAASVLSILCLQVNVPIQPRLTTPEEMISHAIEFGVLEGNMQKQIARMGDATAVSVTKVLGDRNLSPTETQVVLAILRSSFADPSGVEAVSDREPRTALFVLNYLSRCPQDAGTRKEIEDTKTYLLQQFARYKAQSKPTGSAQ